MMAARIGTPRFGLYTQPGEIVDRMPRYMAMHVRQWFPRPDCGFTFTDPELLRFYLGCVPYLAPAGVLGLAELMYGSQPAAYYYGFLHRGAFWGYRPAYEAGFAETSPGAILQKELQSVLYRSGYDTFDMLRGDFAYKQRYATRVNQNLDIRLAC
jgi:CelD/BcsL family acetyltransferase involved in cellulose biosynthesis